MSIQNTSTHFVHASLYQQPVLTHTSFPRFSRSLKVENGKRKKSHPVLLMPEEDPNPPWKCSPSNAMSSIGFMAFVISVVNAVISAVNNVNNNNNNNNNNDNSNNDNNNNINIGNMATDQTSTNTVSNGGKKKRGIRSMATTLSYKDIKDLRDYISEEHVDAHLRNNWTGSNNYTNEDIILAATKVGLDYIQLWHDSDKSSKTKDLESNVQWSHKTHKQITIQKFKEMSKKHQNMFDNKIKEANHISRTLCKAAILSL